MNKAMSYTVGIIIAVIVIAAVGFMFIQKKGAEPTPTVIPVLPTAPSFDTSDAESSSVAAESSTSGFVDEATPTPDQVVPDLS
ncbi:MAG: hypothetical protein HY361_02445 [Candidatus Aenigmarchaeota archaeon]|nr:hypothetical protein [Candidatus Aenigmarchaeota archaeon]